MSESIVEEESPPLLLLLLLLKIESVTLLPRNSNIVFLWKKIHFFNLTKTQLCDNNKKGTNKETANKRTGSYEKFQLTDLMAGVWWSFSAQRRRSRTCGTRTAAVCCTRENAGHFQPQAIYTHSQTNTHTTLQNIFSLTKRQKDLSLLQCKAQKIEKSMNFKLLNGSW